MEHSKLPWRIDNDHKCIASADDTAILKYRYSIGPKQLANAEYIVRACNAFPKLVAACEKIMRLRADLLEGATFMDEGALLTDGAEVFDEIEAALALATLSVEPEKE